MTRITLALSIAASALLAAAIAAPEAAAQRILTSEQLLTEARSAGRSNDWVGAFGYLMAYVQRDPAEMAAADYQRQILEALNAAGYNARVAAVPRGGGGASAGVSGKGDTVAGTGAAGSFRRFDVPAASGHPGAYRMECRGGGRMHANYYPSGEAVQLKIHFAKARAAARDRPPGPGECAWLDRPVHPDEPFWLRWRFSRRDQGIGRIMFGSADGVPGLGLQPSRSDDVPGLIMETTGRPLAPLIEAIHRGRPFAVECYNDRQGGFVVTRVLM
jgi:hypothetical protein